ncbi:antibiotic biosynthesis monooxygenase [Microbacterium sp. BR1]|uniref:antibiotic biosynthesis monooxygenase n=1 Tax=Microbacterium sp. BR1 TaxID=1070896 RepID=UPI000C2CA0A6|nr:antibiotic biosynthesis monooxygenase [Microbacterium sp. BR1]
MILEHAILPVRAGTEADFEAAFAEARPVVANQPGCRSVSLSRSIESPRGASRSLVSIPAGFSSSLT